jgi:tyrosinase
VVVVQELLHIEMDIEMDTIPAHVGLLVHKIFQVAMPSAPIKILTRYRSLLPSNFRRARKYFFHAGTVVCCTMASTKALVIFTLLFMQLASYITQAHAQTTPGTGSCNVATLRKSLANIPQAELSRYVNAVNTLRNTRGTNRVSVFENFAQAHVSQVNNAHFGAYFLPWHRQMLYEFELALNRVAPPGPTISIPFWDWSVVNTNFKRDFDTWGKMGGAIQGQPIPNAPFARWSSRVETRHNVIRGFTVGGSVPTNEFLSSPGTINALVTSGDAFAVMSNSLEIIHNSPHRSVGGDMNNLRVSPNDPIFFSHHAYIDLIWRRWQLAGGQNTFGGTHPGSSNIPARLDQPQQPWGRTVRVILETLTTCVQYQTAQGSVRQRHGEAFESSERAYRGPHAEYAAGREVEVHMNENSPDSTSHGGYTSPPSTTKCHGTSVAVSTNSHSTGTPGPGYIPAKLDGNLGKKPSMFSSMTEKRQAQLKAAEACVRNPRIVKKQMEVSSGAKEWIVTAMKVYNYTSGEIKQGSASYDRYELMRGVDLLLAKPNATETEMVKSAKACIAAIHAGTVPSHSDDTDVAY